MPYCDIHTSITPDILHQVNGGVFSNLTTWCEAIIVGRNELDNRVQRLPPAHGVRHFSNGFSILMRKSAKEWKCMTKILLGSIIGAVPKRVIKAARSLLDFIYLAQYTSHSDENLGYMEEALKTFHKEKGVFQELWPGLSFDFPKLHSLLHFSRSIRLFGATDNYNTEQFEHLHIDLAKDAYRASNKREERLQMIKWLERIEQIDIFRMVLAWRKANILQQPPLSQFAHTTSGDLLLLAKHPPFAQRTFDTISVTHRAPDFERCLKIFLREEGIEPRKRRGHYIPLEDATLSFEAVPVWTKVRMCLPDAQELNTDTQNNDAFYAHPTRNRFDTVLVDVSDSDNLSDDDNNGMQGI